MRTIYKACLEELGETNEFVLENTSKNPVIRPLNCQHRTVVMEYMFSDPIVVLERIILYLPPFITKIQIKNVHFAYIYSIGHRENKNNMGKQKGKFIFNNVLSQGKANEAIIGGV